MNERSLVSEILHSSTFTNMGCTSSKEAQTTTTTRTEKTEAGYKHITKKRTKHPGFLGGETVETITTTLGGNPRVVAIMENGIKYDLSDGQSLYQFAKGSCVRTALWRLVLQDAMGCSSSEGSINFAARTITAGSHTLPCMFVGAIAAHQNSAKLTWGWAHPQWKEKVDAPVKRLQLMGEALNNKDLKSDAITVSSPNPVARAEELMFSAVSAASQVLGWTMWCSLAAPDGETYLLLADAGAAKPPLPASALSNLTLADLHTRFKEIWDSMSPSTFNDGVEGLASSGGWQYETTGDGWCIVEPGSSRRLVFKWDGSTNADGYPQYEHTLYSTTPVTIDGVACDLEVSYTIKPEESENVEAPAGARRTDCKQLIDFSKDTFMYPHVRSCAWFRAAADYLGASGMEDVAIDIKGPNKLELVSASNPGPVLVVPGDVVATIDTKTRLLEWVRDDPRFDSSAAGQIKSAGEDLQNSDLSSPILAIAPDVNLEIVSLATALAAATTTDLHVTAVWELLEGVLAVAVLRVDEVKEVADEDIRPASVYHGFDALWTLRAMYNLENGALHLAVKQGWNLSELHTPLPGWVLEDPATNQTFTFQDDRLKRETGVDYKIALDIKITVEMNGAPARLNIHTDNSPQQ